MTGSVDDAWTILIIRMSGTLVAIDSGRKRVLSMTDDAASSGSAAVERQVLYQPPIFPAGPAKNTVKISIIHRRSVWNCFGLNFVLVSVQNP